MKQDAGLTGEEVRVLTITTVRKPTVWERRAFAAGRDHAIEQLPTYAERPLTMPSELLLLISDPLMGPAMLRFVKDVMAFAAKSDSA